MLNILYFLFFIAKYTLFIILNLLPVEPRFDPGWTFKPWTHAFTGLMSDPVLITLVAGIVPAVSKHNRTKTAGIPIEGSSLDQVLDKVL